MRHRHGFTLLEVVVALALAALTTAIAQRIYGVLLDSTATAERARLALDRQVNARRTLTALAGSLEIGRYEQSAFDGGPHRAAFSSWVTDRYGRPELLRISVSARDSNLVLDGLPGGTLVIRDSVASLEIDYLLVPGADARWVRAWSSSMSAPLALRLRLVGATLVDTLLLVIGTRG